MSLPPVSPSASPPDDFAARQARLRALAAAQAAADADTRINDVPPANIRKLEATLFGANAVVDLINHRNHAAANVALRRTAAWFDLPHPQGKDPRGEADFAALKLCQAWYLLSSDTGTPSPLESSTRDAIRQFFLTHDFASLYQSENHVLMFHASRHLMAQAWPDAMFSAYAKTGAQLATEDAAWLSGFIRQRARFGWGEFDSVCYLDAVWEILLCLHDHTRDASLRRITGMMLDVLLAGMAVNSLDGMYCGAHGRIYADHALDHANEPVRILQYLYFGYDPPPVRLSLHDLLLITPASGWRPSPFVLDLAHPRTTPYENRERKHLHNLADTLPVSPLPGSIRKYSWCTPRYVLGCVQYQDAYPAAAACACHNHYELPIPADQRYAAGYAYHQQHNWDLTFTATNRTDARLFTHHPGTDGTHNYWTGDRLCGCGHFFQNRQALVALYDIDPAQPLHFIHACLPQAAFDEVVDDPASGWIFVRAGDSFAGLWFSSARRWTTAGEWAGREVVSDGLRHGIVCEVGDTETHTHFAAFRQTLLASPITFDREAMTLKYHSSQAGILFLDTRGARRLDGSPADLDYATHDSPFMHSAWGSGVIEFLGATSRITLDFTTR
ncbi:hypothetical protein OPIT5_05825 [Opitutaceae bacterium TAV5]|nr:hypothetical protein OPIT5_05825 [Opitutaceae bacterium TAV5]